MGRTSDAIAEGVSIASAAARLTLRNQILVEVIAHDAPFDADTFVGLAHQTIVALADEQDAAAEMVGKQRRRAWGKFSDPDGTHDYRDRDTRNLRRRQRQYRGVARELRRLADDLEALRVLIEQARESAWGDVEANLQRRLKVEAMRPDLDPDYERMRSARMQSLRLVDLPKLAAHKRQTQSPARAARAGVTDAAPARRAGGIDLSELDS
ncbi:asparagine synthase [Microbacterium thalassium]|uniref:Asparagine synthase n=1 Tax=Microbacterium thalassium TaxID=362649 RepID=A0A7X0FTT5_9MICO|nr:asparagine synthase [Microbacterium thalassium]MBB6393052.1 hypothetical protein [Microbacterium thalassium]GLK22717.1 hypothetical protein GCM10017607_00350 [Microbacterium thalassium]